VHGIGGLWQKQFAFILSPVFFCICMLDVFCLSKIMKWRMTALHFHNCTAKRPEIQSVIITSTCKREGNSAVLGLYYALWELIWHRKYDCTKCSSYLNLKHLCEEKFTDNTERNKSPNVRFSSISFWIFHVTKHFRCHEVMCSC
jgi:hypothetical protein